MQNFSSLASILDNFFYIFPEKFIIFQTILKRVSNNSKSEYAKFQLSSIYPDGLRNFFSHFSKKNSLANFKNSQK
jgi:hypothetical protein